MKPFLKYLLTVCVVIACTIGIISWQIHQKNTLPNFSIEFDKRDLGRIQALAWKDFNSKDETNSYSQNKAAASLGKALFFDQRFSKNGDMSCATCHEPKTNWTSQQPQLKRDVPSLWNVAHNRWFFWDGRADSLWSQALGPLENSFEQAGSRTQFAKLISEDPQYRSQYENVFGKLPDITDNKLYPVPAKPSKDDAIADKNWQSMTAENQLVINRIFVNIGKAIAAFEQQVITAPTRFDSFAEGISQKDQQKVNLLSASEQRGLKIFIGKGKCTLCHSGPNFSDREFHFIHLPLEESEQLEQARLSGVKKLYASPFNSLGKFSDDKKGKRAERLTFLKVDPESIGHYKTPTLRNAVHTAPYMHNGQFKTLRQVIDFYSEMKDANNRQPHLERVLKPLLLNESEKVDLEAFLRSLSK